MRGQTKATWNVEREKATAHVKTVAGKMSHKALLQGLQCGAGNTKKLGEGARGA